MFSSKKTTKWSQLVVTILLVSIIGTLYLIPKEAEAQWAVFDVPNTAINTITASASTITAQSSVSLQIKELGLDGVAWFIAKRIVQNITASTVNWINSGFKGNPAFVVSPDSYFLDIADRISGEYILNNDSLNFVCSPFRANVRLTLAQNYLYRPYPQCTFTRAIGNVENFADDFYQGGWDGWFQFTQRRTNNPVGSYLQAENELLFRISKRQGNIEKQLEQGKGFLSFETCDRGVPTTKTVTGGGKFELQPDGSTKYVGGKTIDVTEAPCIPGTERTATPGSVISGQLEKVLGSGVDQLNLADEFNEVVNALFNQMINKVVGGGIRGLRGLSSPNSSDKNKILTEELLKNDPLVSTPLDSNNPGTGQDVSILDIPLPTFRDPNTVPRPSNPVFPNPDAFDTSNCDINSDDEIEDTLFNQSDPLCSQLIGQSAL